MLSVISKTEILQLCIYYGFFAAGAASVLPLALPVPLNVTAASTLPLFVRRTTFVPVYVVPSTSTTFVPSLPKKATF